MKRRAKIKMTCIAYVTVNEDANGNVEVEDVEDVDDIDDVEVIEMLS